MSDIKSSLTQAAWKARKSAYAPYSGFAVGAAALGADGVIYTGCNIENASYGLSNCAERTAIFKMVSAGCRELHAIAIAGGSGGADCFPCGACRQVIAEFACSGDMPVIVSGADGSSFETVLDGLLPHAFSPRNLEAQGDG